MGSLYLARALSLVLAATTLVTVVYTCATDGSPFRWVILTPWMAATLIDFYANVAVLAAWVCYKEESWLERFFWVAMLICFGSMATGVYVAIQLFKLGPNDPLYHALLRKHHANRAA